MKPIISEISALQKKFFDSTMGELKAATEGGAYLKGKVTPELTNA